MPNNENADFTEDMTCIVFDGERIEIPDMDSIFYNIYRREPETREGLKDELIKECRRAGITIPDGKEEDFGYALVKKYRKTMNRGCSDI